MDSPVRSSASLSSGLESSKGPITRVGRIDAGHKPTLGTSSWAHSRHDHPSLTVPSLRAEYPDGLRRVDHNCELGISMARVEIGWAHSVSRGVCGWAESRPEPRWGAWVGKGGLRDGVVASGKDEAWRQRRMAMSTGRPDEVQ